MKAPVIAVAFAVGLGSGPGAHRPAFYAAGGDTVLALESTSPGSDGNPGPDAGVPAFVDAYLRLHADVRADVTIVGFPVRGTTGGAAAEPASDRAGEENPRTLGQTQIQPRLARAHK